MAKKKTPSPTPAPAVEPASPAPTPDADGVVWRGAAKLRPLLMRIADLHKDPRNARLHDERSHEAIRASMRRFGQRKPIVVDAGGKIIAGNGGFEAALREGWTHVAVVDADGLDENEAKAFALADNRTAELSTWDSFTLADQLKELVVDMPLADLGFTDAELVSIDKRNRAENARLKAKEKDAPPL